MSSGSVVRNRRRTAPSRQSSPYSRPPQIPKKEKSWPWSGIWNIFQPITDRMLAAVSSREEECYEYEELPSEIEIENGLQPTTVFEPLAQQEPETPPSRAPPQQASSSEPTFSPFSLGSSPMKARDQVAEFLHRKEKSGTPLNEMEVAGIMSLLKKDAEETYEPESFRFSNSPSTPAQSPQPTLSPTNQASSSSHIFGQSQLPTFTNNLSNTTNSPRKFLTRNPNGEYKWTGGGSARAATPASRRGSPYRTRQPSPVKSDSKRRRVGEDREGTAAERSGSPQATTSASSTNEFGLNGIQRAPARILRPTLRPKTTPTVPSPLRQVVNGASPPGSPPAVPGAAPATQATSRSSRAATVLSAIIEQATAPPKPDVSNPYQTASPVKPIVKPREKRRQPERKLKEKATEKQKEAPKNIEAPPSPVAVIGATIPKGAKRSRPPPGLSKSSSPSKVNGSEYRLFGGDPHVNGRGRESESQQTVDEAEQERPSPTKKLRSVSVEEVEDEETDDYETVTYATPSEVIEPTESAGIQKITTNLSFGESKPSNGLFGSPSPTETTNGSASTSSSMFGTNANASAKSASSVFGSLKSSAPKEPSKLRASFVAEEDEVVEESFKKSIFPSTMAPPSSTNIFLPSFAAPPAKNPFSSPFGAPLNGPVPESISFGKPVKTQKTDPKEIAMDVDEKDLPRFPFTLTRTVSLSDNADARLAALDLPVTALPTFDLSKPLSAKSSKASSSAGGVPIASKEGFNWAAAGLKAPAAKADAEWQCSVCMLKNPASATVKCSICEAPRPPIQSAFSSAPVASATPAPAVKTFNWSAAGIAPPPKSSESWKCSVCFLDNPATAIEKCTVCESPRR